MVVKRSEYQNQYRSSVIKKHQVVYLENLNLRHQRRDREFLHTPLCWDSLSEEEEVPSSDSCGEGEKKAAKELKQIEPQEQYQSLAEILSDAREKAEALRQKKKQEDVTRRPAFYDRSKQEKEDKPVQKKEVEDLSKKDDCPSFEKLALENKDDVNPNVDKKHLADKSYSIYDMVDDENKKLNQKLARTYAITPEGKLREDISDETDTDRDMKLADKLRNEDAEVSEMNLRKKTYTKKRSKESQGQTKKRPASSKSKASTRPASAGYSRRDCCRTPYPASSETFVPPHSYVPRVRRPDRQAPIPKAKCTSATPESPIKERPPFVAYGVGDREDNLALHRTHNVRALADVYLPALRAKTRREERMRRQKDKIQRAHSAEALLDKLSSVSPREPTDWESEYRKQYHGYEPRDYERAVSARAVVPRALPVRAIHRGGCLVVHVD